MSQKDQVEILPDIVIKTHGAMDGIINNARIIQHFVPISDLEYEEIDRIININFYGTLYMVKSFLPYLKKRPKAHIANVSSISGFIPFPGQTFCGASKVAVKLLTEGLYAELSDTQVGVTLIHPSAIETNIMFNSGVRSNVEESELKERKNNIAMDAGKAAEVIINAIEENKFLVMEGKDARILDLLYQKAVWLIAKKMSNMSH